MPGGLNRASCISLMRCLDGSGLRHSFPLFAHASLKLLVRLPIAQGPPSLKKLDANSCSLNRAMQDEHWSCRGHHQAFERKAKTAEMPSHADTGAPVQAMCVSIVKYKPLIKHYKICFSCPRSCWRSGSCSANFQREAGVCAACFVPLSTHKQQCYLQAVYAHVPLLERKKAQQSQARVGVGNPPTAFCCRFGRAREDSKQVFAAAGYAAVPRGLGGKGGVLERSRWHAAEHAET